MSKKHGYWIDSLSGKNRDLEKRAGISPVRFSRPGSPTWEEDKQHRETYKDKMVDAYRNDYDMRRSMEAAALSGKKKAQKLNKKGIKNIDDIRKWQNFSEKAAKRHGQGGAFDSSTDYMGLTNSMVQRDRSKQTEGYNKDFALGADLAALRQEMDERFDEKSENTLPAQLSTTSETATTGLDDYELDLGSTGTDIFGGGTPKEQADAQDFKDNVVGEVKKGIQLSNVETRGPRSGVIPGTGF